MSASDLLLQEPLSLENEAETAKLESLAHSLGEGVPELEGFGFKKTALLARSSAFLDQQARALLELAVRQNAVLPSDVLKKMKPISVLSSEVTVYPDKDRVYKVTRGRNFFGLAVSFEEHRAGRPFFKTVKGTPFEYIQRLALANRVFGDDNRFEGVILDRYGPRIVTSQHYFNAGENRLIENKEIDQYMRQKGFHREWPRTPGSLSLLWCSPADGVIAWDARPENFQRKKNGGIFPVDLMLLQVAPEKFGDWGWKRIVRADGAFSEKTGHLPGE